MFITPIQPQTTFTGKQKILNCVLEPTVSNFKKMMIDKKLSMRFEEVKITPDGKTNIGRAVLQRQRKAGNPIDLQVAYDQVEKGKSIEPVAAFNISSLDEAISFIAQKFQGKKIIDQHNTGFNMVM